MRELNQKSYSVIATDTINQIGTDNPIKLIEKSELYYQNQLAEAVERITSSNGKYQVVLLCGPSSSGKTTTSHKLAKRLRETGTNADVLSMDNFFIGIDNYPLRPDGKPDMESVETLDIKLLNECLRDLLYTGESKFPVFDFTKQLRNEELNSISLKQNEVVIMEGIHALNPAIIQDIPKDKIFRMYVSVRTKFVKNGENILKPSEIRLVRRMVRDTLFRGYSVKQTIEYWNHVIQSEKIYIDPYRDDVDFKMDTILDYEVCTWHRLLHTTVTAGDLDEFKKYSFMENILRGLLEFIELSPDLIPNNSLLREFIG